MTEIPLWAAVVIGIGGGAFTGILGPIIQWNFIEKKRLQMEREKQQAEFAEAKETRELLAASEEAEQDRQWFANRRTQRQAMIHGAREAVAALTEYPRIETSGMQSGRIVVPPMDARLVAFREELSEESFRQYLEFHKDIWSSLDEVEWASTVQRLATLMLDEIDSIERKWQASHG